ncbi:MAG TPA: HAMP domain-containing sensor histidine kinase [Candidatus Thermoplasmatota archaeon]|nr:HAMP domain-containing sensor histidine kinase [Candidatus Thermoplasmatota archaeon]
MPRPAPFPRTLAGPAATLLVLAVVEAARRVALPGSEPLPGSALAPALVAVVYAAFVGGYLGGGASAVLTTAYAAYALQPLGSASLTLRLVLVGGSAFALVLLVGRLKRRGDEAAAAALVVEREALQRERRHGEELEKANEQLLRLNETLEAFAYVTAHDLKEPARATAQHLDDLAHAPLPAEAARHVEAARESNRRLGALLHGLLEFSRASMTTVEKEPVLIPDVLRSELCEAQYHRLLRERDAVLECDPDLPPVWGSQAGLAQVFGNLVVNALKHNPQPQPVVRIRRGDDADEGVVHVVVEDNGPGFPAQVVRRFESLRVDRPSTVRGGFGLAISRRAVERLGGTMALATGPEGGGVVHLRFRAAPRAAPAAPAPPAEARLPPTGNP